MVYHYKRKNDKLNNAAAGLASGAIQGLQLGMQAKQAGIANARADEQMRRQAANDEFERAQALRKAQMADEELQREARARSAAAESVVEMAAPAPKVQIDTNPLIGGAVTAARGTQVQDETVQRVQGIAKRMAENGVDPRYIRTFVEESAKKHKDVADKDQRKALIGRIGSSIENGEFFGTNPDGSRSEVPALNDGLGKLSEMIGNPDVPVDAIEQQYRTLQGQMRVDRTRKQNRARELQKARDGMARVADELNAKPARTAEEMAAQSAQMGAIQQTIDEMEMAWDDLHPEKDNATAQRARLRMNQQLTMALNGYSHVSEATGRPVTFAEAETDRQMTALLKQQKAEADFYRAEYEKFRAMNAPAKAELDARNTESLISERGRVTGRDNSVSDYRALAELVDAQLVTDEKYNGLLEDDPTAAAKYRADKIAAEREAARTLGAQATTDRAVLGNKKAGGTRESRQADIEAHPERYGAITTQEELDRFLETGELPK